MAVYSDLQSFFRMVQEDIGQFWASKFVKNEDQPLPTWCEADLSSWSIVVEGNGFFWFPNVETHFDICSTFKLSWLIIWSPFVH